MDIETQIKAAKALEFLRDHPALNNDRGDSLFNGAWFHMELCCRNGKSQWAGSDGVTIWKSDPNWEKHKAYFDEDSDDDTPEDLKSAKVPYAEVYGEPWVADHMEYWWEVSFYTFASNPYDKKDAYTIDGKWDGYEGVSGGARSFEEMAINAADRVREVFGDFDSSSFVTEAEEKNHNSVVPMNFKPMEDKPGYSECIFNDKYVDVYQGLINLRWLKWFMGTDYAKKNWGHHVEHEWQTLVKKIEELEPESRKKLLAS